MSGEPQITVGVLRAERIAFVLQGGYRDNEGRNVEGEQAVRYVQNGIEWNGAVYERLCFTPSDKSSKFLLRDVVIGIGINVNTEGFPEELPHAASLRQYAGKPLLRAELIALCMEYFEKYYDRFEKKEDLGDLKEEYERLLVNKGKQVRVLEPGREHTGTALGISSQGELLVELEDGSIEKVYAGEVSVRGVYGYV